MVQIRPAAIQEIHRLLARQSAYAASPSTQAYLTLEPGGCAEWTYRLTTLPQAQRTATTQIDCGEISLAIATEHWDLLQDLVIDYAEDLMGGGFRFINPLAQRTCGCGNAFALNTDTPIAEDCSMAGLPNR